MEIPKVTKSVLRMPVSLSYEQKLSGIVPQCDPNEDCLRRGPFGIKYDDPVCLARRSACQGKLAACVVGIIGAAAYTGGCAGCIIGNIAVGGAALMACTAPCGITAGAMQLIAQNCG